ILACFQDPVGAVKAAAGMQRALAEDREGRAELDQIHIRIGLHTGLGLIKDGDVFGDVVHAASRVPHQADVEQILLRDVWLEAARQKAADDLQSEIRFQLEEAIRARQQVEQDLVAAQQKFEAERNYLKAQIAGMQASAVEAMERSNNPARLTLAVNEKVEARLA